MANFEIRKKLTFDDFNNYGKQVLEENNIDKNKDGVIQGSELNTLFEKVGGGNYGDISRLLATKDSGMRNTSRVETPEGQAAIENFNNMTSDEKNSVLKNYSDALKVRIDFLHDNYEKINTNNKGVNSKMDTLKDILLKKYAMVDAGNDYTKEADELTFVLKTYQAEFEQYIKSLDGQVADALIEFGGKDVFGNRDSQITGIANHAISKVNVLKQDIKSSFDKLQNLAYEMIYNSGDNNQKKVDVLKIIIENFEQLQKRISAGQEDIKNSVGAVEEATMKTLDYIKSSQSEEFLNNGIPTNLDMENKVAEGVLMDILMDAPQASATTGIERAKTDSKQNAPIYDLSGRQVSGELQKGQVYIQNGKKFIAK